MSTKIEWTDKTWNPITGCSPISEGCQNCYAKKMANRLRGRFGYPKDDPFRVTFHPDRLNELLKWKKSKQIFVCSMGDLFHEDVKQEWLDDIFGAMSDKAEYHTFIILTKRPQKMSEYIRRRWNETDGYWQNIWLGVSVENQKTANERIPILLQIPAKVRFVSFEPLLEKVDMYPICRVTKRGIACIDWVIVGAETGPNARLMDVEWTRHIKNQCKLHRKVHDYQIAFFMKQMSNRESIPEDLMIREWPNIKEKNDS